jgi:hypothetical protein
VLELATLLSFFDTLEDRDRTSVLTAFNVANTIAAVAGTLCGAAVFRFLDLGPGVYTVLFVGSSCARALVLWLLPKSTPAGRMPEDMSLRTLAVRPSAGAIQRPILSTLEDAKNGGSP